MDPLSEEVQGLEPDIIEHDVHDRPRHPIHERSSPLPRRVKSGKVTDQTLTFHFPEQESEEIPWDQVELMSLGLIEETPTDVSGPKGAMRQMFGKLTGKASDNEERKTRQSREVYLLDVYVRDRVQPYRMDSATVNYKSFLGADMSYVSFQNFFRLATRLARHAVNSRFDESLVFFFTRRRDQMRKFTAVYDYELELQQSRQKLEHLATHDQLKLDREAWAEEWGEVLVKALTPQEVDHVAHLARLEITPDEREAFSRQLGEILTYVEQLSAIDTEGVEPLLSVFGRADVLRDDEARPPLGVERVLQNAPEQESEQFRIPRILEEGS